MRDSDAIDTQIDQVIKRTEAQLGVLEQRAHQLASVISGGKYDQLHQ